LDNIIEDKCAMLKIHLAYELLAIKKESKKRQKKKNKKQ
jgi:hypothetical protein